MPASDPQRGWFLGGALMVSALAQIAFRSGSYHGGLGLCAVAAALVGWATRGTTSAAEATSSPRDATIAGPAAGLALVALVSTLVLQLLDRAYLAQITLWLVGVVALQKVCRDASSDPPLAGSRFVLATLIGLALLLRLPALEWYPTGMHGDEGSFGLWAVRVARGDGVAPFAVGWDDHPTLFSYLQGAVVAVMGQTVAANRAVPACLGALSVWPLYQLAHRLWGTGAAVVASLLLAVLPWHLYFSRLALNDIGVVLCAIGTLAAFVALRQRPSAAFTAGTWLGLSLYGGNKAVMVLAMAGVGAVATALAERPRRWPWREWGCIAASFAFVAAPQLLTYTRQGWYGPLLRHPMSRLVEPAAATQSWVDGVLLALTQVERSLLAFLYYPDRSIFLSFSTVPLLPPAIATCAWVGFLLCLRRWRAPYAVGLLAWFAIGCLGSILTKNPPQAHHLVPMLALPLLFATLALVEMAAVWPLRRSFLPAAAVLVVLLIGFDAWRETVTYYLKPTPWTEVTEIARAMRALDSTHEVVLVTAPMADNNGTLQYIAGAAMRAPKLYQELDRPWRADVSRDVAFIVSWRRYAELPKLRTWYPSGRAYEYGSAPGARFLTIYEVPRAAVQR